MQADKPKNTTKNKVTMLVQGGSLFPEQGGWGIGGQRGQQHLRRLPITGKLLRISGLEDTPRNVSALCGPIWGVSGTKRANRR